MCLLRLLQAKVAALGAFVEETFPLPVVLQHRAAVITDAFRCGSGVTSGMLAHGLALGADAISPLVLCL